MTPNICATVSGFRWLTGLPELILKAAKEQEILTDRWPATMASGISLFCRLTLILRGRRCALLRCLVTASPSFGGRSAIVKLASCSWARRAHRRQFIRSVDSAQQTWSKSRESLSGLGLRL